MQKVAQYCLGLGCALLLATIAVACGTNPSYNSCTTNDDCRGDRMCTDGTCTSLGTSSGLSPSLPAIDESSGPTPGSGGGGGGGGGGTASCTTLCSHLLALCGPLFEGEMTQQECEMDCAADPLSAAEANCVMSATQCEQVFACDFDDDDDDWNGTDNNEPVRPDPGNNTSNNGTSNNGTSNNGTSNNGTSNNSTSNNIGNHTSGGLTFCEVAYCYEDCDGMASCEEACDASASPEAAQKMSVLDACVAGCSSANDFWACIDATCPNEVDEYEACF